MAETSIYTVDTKVALKWNQRCCTIYVLDTHVEQGWYGGEFLKSFLINFMQIRLQLIRLKALTVPSKQPRSEIM